jgi:hypothetical protein
VPALDLVELVDRKVADRLAEMNGRIETLVAEAVDRELDRLVGGLVEDDLDRRAEEARDEVTETSLTQRRCPRCGDAKPLDAFPLHRRICRTCKSRADKRRRREREQLGDAETEEAVPFAGPGSTPTGSPAATTAASSASSSPTRLPRVASSRTGTVASVPPTDSRATSSTRSGT